MKMSDISMLRIEVKNGPPLRNIGSITETPHKQRFFKMFAQLFIGGECDCLAEIPSIRV